MTPQASDSERAAKRAELESLYARARRIEAELEPPSRSTPWPPREYYMLFHVLVGLLLGLVGAASSLLFNIVGSLFVGQHPLELIRVYLTFPLGEEALAMSSGMALGVGTCLYLATGSLYGVAFHVVMTRWLDRISARRRLAWASALGLGLWIVNFYGLLIWIQPMLFGGRWIVELVPFWVAALTHLVFAWTMLLIEQWGKFVPYAPLGE
ncbi:MAG: hypothetical protein V3U98_09485 [Acidobacteriota bacterium]